MLNLATNWLEIGLYTFEYARDIVIHALAYAKVVLIVCLKQRPTQDMSLNNISYQRAKRIHQQGKKYGHLLVTKS